MSRDSEIRALETDWAENPRWQGVERTFSAQDVVRLRGSVAVEYTLARRGAEPCGGCWARSPISMRSER